MIHLIPGLVEYLVLYISMRSHYIITFCVCVCEYTQSQEAGFKYRT